MHFKSVLAAFFTFASASAALNFDLPSVPQGQLPSKCLSQWIPQGQPVMVEISSTPNSAGQTINVNIFDDSSSGNKYAQQFGITKQKFEFQTQAHANVIICFDNLLQTGIQPGNYYSSIKIDMDSGASVLDNSNDLDAELNPIELELRRLETNLEEIQEFLNHLKSRESDLRDLNELANSRVSTFSWLTIIALFVIATSQVFYFRRFFKAKKLI
ncbi:hypothetical protein BB560_007160 [Smittium megazygosporum]|uniref:GOLD domain-containing protein n=1 Tax=Smittium megazygosporum TaxID=133381 RepID=A0A2T9XYG4_9FUNG|nr:hypothetical protein BB560_007160 [Smittium megazygosporum]